MVIAELKCIQCNSHSRYSTGLPHYNTSNSSWLLCHDCGMFNWSYKIILIRNPVIFKYFFRYCQKMIWKGYRSGSQTERKLTRKYLRLWKSRMVLTTAARLLIENVIISLGCACRSCRREPQKGQSYEQKVSWLNGRADIIFFTYTQIACWLACVSVRSILLLPRHFYHFMHWKRDAIGLAGAPMDPFSSGSSPLSNRVNFVNMSVVKNNFVAWHI